MTPEYLRARRAALSQDQTSAFKLGMWARAHLLADQSAMAWVDRNIRAASGQSEGTTTAGGALVPAELAADVFAARQVSGVFRRNADVRNINADVRSFPRRTSGQTATWASENDQLTESTAAFDLVGATARKLTALTRLSSEVLEDSAEDLGAFLAAEIGSALALAEDDAGFNGTGTPAFGGHYGICQKIIDANHTAGAVTAAAGHDTFAEIDATDIGNLMGALPEQFWQNAKFYCSAYAAANTFCRLGATAGSEIMSLDGPRPVLNYLGFPIELTPKLPGSGSQTGNAMILFGDLKRTTILASRRELRLATTPNRYLEYDQIGVRATVRVGIVSHNLGDASTAGGTVALVGA